MLSLIASTNAFTNLAIATVTTHAIAGMHTIIHAHVICPVNFKIKKIKNTGKPASLQITNTSTTGISKIIAVFNKKFFMFIPLLF